jgi:uncharacterized protein (DUF433 family)
MDPVKTNRTIVGIKRTPGVCGNAACIADTRIPVWVLERARQLGMSDADLLESYPTLRAEDLTNAWAYVRLYREEIEEEIRLRLCSKISCPFQISELVLKALFFSPRMRAAA